MNRITLKLCAFLFFLISCNNKTDKLKENIYVMKLNDTLEVDKIFHGTLKLINTFDDTIKVSDKKGELNKVYINIFNPLKDVFKIKETDCYLFENIFEYSEKKPNYTSFTITPKKKGNFVVAGFIDRSVFLKTKDSNKLRQIEKRHYFKEKIYVK